jgi:membrane-anchored protein YejM (alkaline phosphatase superfamily)
MFKNINVTVYFLCTWLFSIFLTTHFLIEIPADTTHDHIHSFLALATYGLIYQGPAIISYWLLRRWKSLAIKVAIFFSILGHSIVFIDSHLFDLYAFHINGFVWNLLTTPGGFESLGADQTNIFVTLSYIAVLASVHLVGLYLALKIPKLHIPTSAVVMLFLAATLTERAVYGYSKASLYGPILDRGDALFLYQPMSMNSLLRKLGVDVKKTSRIKLSHSKSEQLDYPKEPIQLVKVDKPFNIIMLVSESMRWNLLTPEIMPNMSAFSEKSWNFTHHYSGGNGTRQGLFSLFYGLHGNYWDAFLRKQQGPILFDVLNDYSYQYFIYTSARFTYPEFDKTLFSQIPPENLIEHNKEEPWKRDRTNTTALINAIQNRDHAKPFYGFLFFEATHARYSFPEEAIIRNDYLKTLDYAGLSRKELAPQIEGMKARYENAAHGIDIQLQRIVQSLEESGDLDNTLVIITGDHGEEFMERGRWGHNSAFTDWQVRTPMIVWMPGSSPKTITAPTSHMDVPITILSRLGVQNPVKDYSLGINLATPKENRNIIVASWSDIGLINKYGKLVIPFKSTTQHKNLAMDLNDNPVDSAALTTQMQSIIFHALNDARYYKK